VTFWEETGTSNTALKDDKGGHTITSTSTNSIIAGGGNHSMTQSDYCGILGGLDNTMGDFNSYSVMLGGRDNNMPIAADNSAMVGGWQNTLENGDDAAIIGGFGNGLSGSSANSVIVGGQYHIFDGSANSNIVGGQYHILSGGSDNSVLLGGYSNLMDSSDSVIAGGDDNEITVGRYHFIGGGQDNIINSGNQNAMVGGSGNTIEDNAYRSFIASGLGNRIFNSDDAILVGGQYNTLSGTSTPSFSSSSAVLVGGQRNVIDQSNYSVLIGGEDNNISGASNRASILAGDSNTIITSSNGSLIGGDTNTLDTSVRSVILGGQNNTISGSTDSMILGGDNNSLNNLSNVVIAGMSSFTAITGDTLYAKNIVAYDGEIKVTNTKTNGPATLKIHGDRENGAGDTGEIVSILEFGTDGTTALNNFKIKLENYMNATPMLFEFDNSGTVTEVMRLGSSTQGDDTVAFYGAVKHDGNTSSGTKSVSFGLTNVVTDNYSSILGGELNEIESGSGTWNTITGGYGNKMSGGSSSFASVMVGGHSNLMGNVAGISRGFMVGGDQNTYERGSYGGILGGQNNDINGSNSNYGGILLGSLNTLQNGSTYSVLVGGSANTINGSVRSIILGGSNITGTTDDMVYVPDLVIDGLPSVDLSTDANGKIIETPSDARLKTKIQDLESPLDKVLGLRGVSYEWTAESNMGTDKTKFGFIAQEVQKVIPELVTEMYKREGMYTLDYKEIIPWLVGAVQELADKKDVTVENMTILNTQTITAEDNVIELNYGGNHDTATAGGLTVIDGVSEGVHSHLKINKDGWWVASEGIIPKQFIAPMYTPVASEDIEGKTGELTWDDDYIYIKTTKGWRRSNLEKF
jgi:hypothetical protein